MWTTTIATLLTCLLLGTGEARAAPGAVPPPGAVATSGAPWLENRGQWRPDVAFGAWVGSAWVSVGAKGLDLHFDDPEGPGPQVVQVEVPSARFHCRGLDRASGVFHDFHGDPSQWVRGVRAYRTVELIDQSTGLRFTLAERDGRLLVDVYQEFEIDRSLRMALSEHARASTRPRGGVLVDTSAGSLEVEVRFLVDGEHRRGEATLRPGALIEWRAGAGVEPAPKALAAAPQPELTWSTLWGSVPTVFCNVWDVADDACVDSQGQVTVVGTVAGSDYILTPGAFQTAERCDDIFVARFDQQTGDLVYSVRIGSTGLDKGKGVAVDSMGRATAVGWVGQGAQGFPTTPNAFDPVKSQFDSAGVIFRLSSDGSQIEYSTYLEGHESTNVYSVALSSTGSAVAVGTTGTGFPTTPGAFSSQYSGLAEGFVTRLDPTGSFLEFSTLIGGSSSDSPVRVRLDVQESVILAGNTGLDYPTTPGAFKSQAQSAEAFVSCLDSTGSILLWSTLVGGSDFEECYDMSLTPDGGAVLVGMTKSADFPTTPGALQETDPGDWNAWAARVAPGGSTLGFGTFIGGTKRDWAFSVATDRSGMVLVGGQFSGPLSFPVTPGSFQATGNNGIFATLLAPDGTKALYTTFITGNGSGGAEAMAIGPTGLTTMGGSWTPGGGTGNPFPTTPGALVPTPLGSRDAFITTLQPLLQGVKLAGTSSPSCLGPVNANATTMPLAGQPFGLYCTQAPPDTDGYLITFTGEVMPSIKPVKSGPEGFLETDLGSLPNTPGKVLRYRYAFRNTPTCPGQGPFSFSNLVVVQVQ